MAPFTEGAAESGAGFRLGAQHAVCGRGDARNGFVTRCSRDGSPRGCGGGAGRWAAPAGCPRRPALAGVRKPRCFAAGLFFSVLLLLLTAASPKQPGAHGRPTAPCPVPAAGPAARAGCRCSAARAANAPAGLPFAGAPVPAPCPVTPSLLLQTDTGRGPGAAPVCPPAAAVGHPRGVHQAARAGDREGSQGGETEEGNQGERQRGGER